MHPFNGRYWIFLAYLTATLFFIHAFLRPIARSETYINLLGYVGLAVEATLAIPQILKNQRARSCKGFRLSVLASWLLGDAMKMSYFFFGADAVPLAFRMCGIFQCLSDCYLGLQYWAFGNGAPSVTSGGPRDKGHGWGFNEKDIRLK